SSATPAAESSATPAAEPPARPATESPATPAAAPPSPRPPAASPRGRSWRDALAEPPEVPVEASRRAIEARSRRDFLLFVAGSLLAAAGAWWLLPDRTRSRLAPGGAVDRLDTLAARVGLTRERRERLLDRALTFD